MTGIVLASGSPRRLELLKRAGLTVEVDPAGIPEEERPGEAPEHLVRRLACEKALAVARRRSPAEPGLVIGADTIVVVDDQVLGKPSDPEHAVRLLRSLVGRVHRVLTGVAVVASPGLQMASTSVSSSVLMRGASDEELRAYVATGEPLDKAGAYALQGDGRRFVVSVSGSEDNVIGLPVKETLALIEKIRSRQVRAGSRA